MSVCIDQRLEFVRRLDVTFMVTSAKMLSSLQVPINSSVLCTVLLALYIIRLLCTNKLLSSG
ncbi:hypothetical protein HanPSC8_Chr09g0373931 [Helianthus annuus]|nr:hypothetical protein HanPSC8_Chr09g0373931 [Helianthus annuus]